MKVQRCVICDEPTGRCEEDSIYLPLPNGDDVGPLCGDCYEERDPPKLDAKATNQQGNNHD